MPSEFIKFANKKLKDFNEAYNEIKKYKRKKFYNTCLSPNFENKSKRDIKFIIIHYTGVKPLKKTLEIFKDPASKVSCHWLISESGKFYKIVEEKILHGIVVNQAGKNT